MPTIVVCLLGAVQLAGESMSKVAIKHGIELTFPRKGGEPSVEEETPVSIAPSCTTQYCQRTIPRYGTRRNGLHKTFGAPSIAEPLDIYYGAVLNEHFNKHVEPNERSGKQMQGRGCQCARYRHLCEKGTEFVPYLSPGHTRVGVGQSEHW
jgi:hypothetical protein